MSLFLILLKKLILVENATTGAFTVTFKTTSGTGVTWTATDKGTKVLYSDGTNVVEGLSSTWSFNSYRKYCTWCK